MTSTFHLVHPYIFLLLVIGITLYAVALRYFKSGIYYRYSLADQSARNGYAAAHPYKIIVFTMRLLFLFILAFIIARPQLANTFSKTNMNGVDIMLAIDVSGSMEIADDKKDGRTRIQIAKDEALHFISKRDDDAIGLVLFAKHAISRCPLTLDKKIVTDIVKNIQLGLLDPSQTYLATGLITAANRLKDSKAKSKIIILLTDGAPSEGDLDPTVAIDVAKQLGIKVYTIGIGGDEPLRIMTPMGLSMYLPVNKELLQKIATSTGGTFFRANNAKDMRKIYDTIDSLEKTKYEVAHYTHYYDIYVPFLWLALLLLVSELILSTFVWFAL